MVEAAQDAVHARAPVAPVVERADAEQQAGGKDVDTAGYAGLGRLGEGGEHQSGDQDGGEHAEMQPTAQLRLDRMRERERYGPAAAGRQVPGRVGDGRSHERIVPTVP